MDVDFVESKYIIEKEIPIMSKKVLYMNDLGKKNLVFCKVTLGTQAEEINADHDRLYFDVKHDFGAINLALINTINSKLSDPSTPANFASEPIPFTVTLASVQCKKGDPINCKDGEVVDPLYDPKTHAINIALSDKKWKSVTARGTADIKVTPSINGLLELVDMTWKVEDFDDIKPSVSSIGTWMNQVMETIFGKDDLDWMEKSDDKGDGSWLDKPDDKMPWPGSDDEDDDEDEEDEEEDDDSDIESEDDDFSVDELD